MLLFAVLSSTSSNLISCFTVTIVFSFILKLQDIVLLKLCPFSNCKLVGGKISGLFILCNNAFASSNIVEVVSPSGNLDASLYISAYSLSWYNPLNVSEPF